MPENAWGPLHHWRSKGNCNDAKIVSVIRSRDESATLQENINSVRLWTKVGLMDRNKDNCKLMNSRVGNGPINMMVVSFLAFLWLVLLETCSSHKDHNHLPHYRVKEEDAKSFLTRTGISKRSTSAELCVTDEVYCETHLSECRLHTEISHETYCNPDPCGPGMTCYMSTPCPAHFRSACDPNPCLAIPCKNGATCKAADTSYTCSCTHGYYGDTCLFDHPCGTAPCTNGGTCNKMGSDFNCSCTDRYTGTNCTKDCRPGPADIVIIMDASISTQDVFNASKEFAASFVEGLSIDSGEFRIALLTYSTDVHQEFGFNTHTNKASVLAGIDNISGRFGASYLNKALANGRQMLLSESSNRVKQYVLVISDGLSTRRQEAIWQSQLLKRSGVTVLCVGIGRQVAQEELLQIATETPVTYVFSSTNKDVLNTVLMETADIDCTDCVINKVSDIVLLVDVSKYQAGQLQRQLDMVKFFIQQVRAYISDTRIAMITFDVRQHVEFNLTGYQDTDSILVSSQIGITTSDRKSNVSGALSFVRESVLSEAREGGRKFVVVFSNEGWTDANAIIRERQSLTIDNVTVAFVPVGSPTDLDIVYSVADQASDVFYVGEYEDNHDEERLKALVARTSHVECTSDIFVTRQ
ncbi:von Willebrand factor A domain-containing protein 2-like [Pecten maximus]|uniref:von Willebrand factor A domain-containing protein 2-like n=1 Tax=Pecten maximus TaxID=6579 RepID=UPI0014583961|nr:von Willebrand factor A domain-containing protein 2-like [Pecten maximus]